MENRKDRVQHDLLLSLNNSSSACVGRYLLQIVVYRSMPRLRQYSLTVDVDTVYVIESVERSETSVILDSWLDCLSLNCLNRMTMENENVSICRLNHRVTAAFSAAFGAAFIRDWRYLIIAILHSNIGKNTKVKIPLRTEFNASFRGGMVKPNTCFRETF